MCRYVFFNHLLLYSRNITRHEKKKTGYVLQGETYNGIQIAASLSMTLGIVLTVFANTKKKKAHDSEVLVEVNPGDLFISVSMMLCAMLLRSLGNVVQQRTYKKYGKHVTEVMFYQHALVRLNIFISPERFLKLKHIYRDYPFFCGAEESRYKIKCGNGPRCLMRVTR